MKYVLITAGVIVFICIVVGSSFLGLYNSVVSQNQNVATAQSSVQTEYQRRFDLIPNLVAATKGYMQQEVTVFGDIAKARTQYAGAAPNTNAQVQATNGYDSAISRLLVVMENYPVLQSVQTVKDLTTELEGTENRIQVARDRYNEQVRQYNMLIVSFPSNIIASMYGFTQKDYFTADTGASTAPTVNLDLTK